MQNRFWPAARLIMAMLLMGTMHRVAQAQMPAPRDNQTLVKVSVDRGRITAYFNNKNLGAFGPTNLINGKDQPVYVDVSNIAHAGKNTLRLTWNEPQPPGANVEVMYAAQSKRFKSVSRRAISNRDATRVDETSTINLPDTASNNPGTGGNAPPSPITEAVEEGPAFSPADDQTILDIALTQGSAAVFVNNTRLRLHNENGLGRADISGLIRPGVNAIRVQSITGSGLRGMLKITYAAVKNNFRVVRVIDWSGKNGGKSVDSGTFTVPGHGGR